ncbi:hypothetical protein [Hyalangium sp.]|uniref:hypothetical protein n=1 Tax=Hyalangium sp. TaxID=2028555 RepID=UPI002D6F129E|nr:hypothetical protein [Hyalangium sp.]HYI03226.1 hypothetical protein [Hyalangium sp.]
MTKNNDIPNPYQGLTSDQVLDTMRLLAAEETRNQILMGLLYNYLLDSQLLKGSQYKNPLDFICGHIQEISRSALLIYSAVARAFTQKVCSQYGVYRLRSLLTYKGAAGIELNYEEPGGTVILVPDEKGEVKPKPFSSCTVDDMRAALLHLRQSTPSTSIPAEQRKLVDQFREAVIRRFPQGSPVRVQLRQHKGMVVVDFRAIPVLQVEKLTEALLDLLYPVREVPEAEEVQHTS